MRWTGAGVHGALLLLALGAAWWSWKTDTAEPAPGQDEAAARTPIWTSQAKAAERVVWRKGENTITVRADPGAPPWVEGTGPLPKKPGPAIRAPGEPEPPPPPEVRLFRGNSRARKALKRMAGPQADRALGVPAPDRLKPLGFAPPKATLEVTVDGETHRLEIGESTFGRPGRYVREPESGRVFIIQPYLVADLDGGESALEALGLFGPAAKKANRAELTLGDATRALLRMKRRGLGADRLPALWADAQHPEKQDPEATGWLRQALALRPGSYRSAELPAEAERLWTLALSRGKKPIGTATLYRFVEDGRTLYVIDSGDLKAKVVVPTARAEPLAAEAAALFRSAE